MEDLLNLKGIGRTIMTSVCDDGHVVHLVAYQDGSWSIFRDGQPCGQWEPQEEDHCLRAFLRYSDPTKPITAIILTSRPRAFTSKSMPSLN